MTIISLYNVYDLDWNILRRLGQSVDPVFLMQSIIVMFNSFDAEKLKLMPR